MEFQVMDRAFKQVWHTEYFHTESDARQYANERIKTGSADVEIYKRTRAGYVPVDSIHLSKHEAIENFAKFVADDAPYFM